MTKYQFLPHKHLNRHIGKPMKLVLKNGSTIYGTVSKVHKHGVVFIPVNTANFKKHKDANAKWFFPLFFPIFLPFLFFFPFLICL